MHGLVSQHTLNEGQNGHHIDSNMPLSLIERLNRDRIMT